MVSLICQYLLKTTVRLPYGPHMYHSRNGPELRLVLSLGHWAISIYGWACLLILSLSLKPNPFMDISSLIVHSGMQLTSLVVIYLVVEQRPPLKSTTR
jgi:hypothetical protein